MKFEPRKYQSDTVKALWRAAKTKCNPVIAVPTGAGKTVIMGMFIQKYLQKYPDNKVTVISHTREILKQDHEALLEFFPYKEIGLYSAGLESRTVSQITVAGIQSIYKKPHLFNWVNLYIIDECHTVNHKNVGMYRKLLNDHPGMKVGMSATVFRSGHGYIYENGGLFDTLAYDLTSIENFNKLVDDGYLTKLISLSTDMQMNTHGVKKSAGDYNIKDLGDKFDRDDVTSVAVSESIKYGKNYKKWLVFAIDTDHADNVCADFKKGGIDAEVLHSKMAGDRTTTIRNFRSGNTRCLVSVGMVTTGFDAPNVDLIILLRPTMSAVLHVQMVGRGLRVAPKKDHCLVLDFAGNTERLGPVNDVRIPKQKSNKPGKAPIKKCPNCKVLVPASARICDVCGFEFQFEVKLHMQASNTEIVRKNTESKIKWLTVNKVQYTRHKKMGKPDSIMVIYHCGITKVKDWVCLDHGGYAKTKADHWANYRGYNGEFTTDDLLEHTHMLMKPKKILVDFTDKYPNIKNSEF
jgi:DNA repair protein RadD